MQCTSKNIELSELIADQERFRILQILEEDGRIFISLCRSGRSAVCALCGNMSQTPRSYYTRTVQDLPILGSAVVLQYIIRRFRCDNKNCRRKIFSEQCIDFIAPYARRTDRAIQRLSKIIIEVSANKGSYISRLSKIPVSASTCLRMIKKMPVTTSDNVEVIGIDDYAKRKGINYGSVIINMKTGRTVDMIDSRHSDDVAKHLMLYQNTQYVCRDRSSSYAFGIRSAIPHAKQIADKFHLLKNFNEHIYKEIQRSYKKIKEEYLLSIEAAVKKEEIPITEAENTEPYFVAAGNVSHRRLALSKDIRHLFEKGISVRSIAKTLHIARNTVRSYLKTQDYSGKLGRYIKNYHDYIPVIIDKIKEGYNIKQIHRYITTIGFEVKLSTFYEWFKNNIYGYTAKWTKTQTLNEATTPSQQIWLYGLSPRKLSLTTTGILWGINKKTGECSPEQSLALKVSEQSPLLQQINKAYTSFRDLLKGKQPHLLRTWIELHENIAVTSVQSFLKGIKQDQDAVENAIRYAWTNSTVEGNVNRLKNKKREMYGRAGFELLKRKVILSVTG